MKYPHTLRGPFSKDTSLQKVTPLVLSYVSYFDLIQNLRKIFFKKKLWFKVSDKYYYIILHSDKIDILKLNYYLI